MDQFGEGGVGVAQRQDAGAVAVHGRQQQEADDVGLGVAHLAEHGAERVGQVKEDAAAGAAGQVGDDVDARQVAAHAEARLAGGVRQGVGFQAGVQFHLQAADDGTVVVAEGEAAQRPDAGRHLRARDAVEHPRVEPAVERGPAVARPQVVAGPVERRQQHVAAGQGGARPAVRRRSHHVGVGVEQQQAQVRRLGRRAEAVMQVFAQPLQDGHAHGADADDEGGEEGAVAADLGGGLANRGDGLLEHGPFDGANGEGQTGVGVGQAAADAGGGGFRRRAGRPGVALGRSDQIGRRRGGRANRLA